MQPSGLLGVGRVRPWDQAWPGDLGLSGACGVLELLWGRGPKLWGPGAMGPGVQFSYQRRCDFTFSIRPMGLAKSHLQQSPCREGMLALHVYVYVYVYYAVYMSSVQAATLFPLS